MRFTILGPMERVETMAVGSGIRVLRFLRKQYGDGRWQKRKGIATIRLLSGVKRKVELHWYEAHGMGKRDVKIKRYLD